MSDLENTDELNQFLALVLANPFIQSPGDKVGARVLMNWSLRHCNLIRDKNQDSSIFIEIIKNLYSNGAILHEKENNRVILIATEKYPGIKNQFASTKVLNANIGQIRFIDPVDSINIDPYEKDYQRKHNLGYYDILIDNLKQYTGPNKDLQIHCPIFFKLLCDILNDRFTDWHTKIMISTSLAYFVLEKDVIPDHQEKGYIDDLFIVSYVLNDIKEKTPELIDNNWNYTENIFDLIEEVYLKTSDILDNYAYEILRKVGLHKFQTLDLEEYSGNYPQKLAKLASEKRELLGIVAFLLNKMNDTNIKIPTLEKIHSMLRECSDYDEILRLIELSKINHDFQIAQKQQANESFKDVLEKRLKEARMNSLQNQ